MMKTKTLVLVIVVLLILNVVVIICFCHFRSAAIQSVKSAVQQSTEYNSLYNSLAYSILNDGSTINAKIFDKKGEELSLSTLFTERPGVSVDLKNLFLVFLSGTFLWNINIYGDVYWSVA